ncbi:hypothetical protein U1Q18_003489 [Sarracenia purpurea var. burkii]
MVLGRGSQFDLFPFVSIAAAVISITRDQIRNWDYFVWMRSRLVIGAEELRVRKAHGEARTLRFDLTVNVVQILEEEEEKRWCGEGRRGEATLGHAPDLARPRIDLVRGGVVEAIDLLRGEW